MIIGIDVGESNEAHMYGHQVLDDYEDVFFHNCFFFNTIITYYGSDKHIFNKLYINLHFFSLQLNVMNSILLNFY
jgi:hypothetical protein